MIIDENDYLLPNMIIEYVGGNQIARFNGEIFIPEIDAEELKNRFNNIKPIVKKNGKYYTLKEQSIEDINKKFYPFKLKDQTLECINESDLIELNAFLSLHWFGYYGSFIPSFKEILSQIPEELLNADYFELVYEPCNTDDYNQFRGPFNENKHVARIKTYKIVE